MYVQGNEGRKETTNPQCEEKQRPQRLRLLRERKELHDLELARDSMSIAKDSQLINCSRVL